MITTAAREIVTDDFSAARKVIMRSRLLLLVPLVAALLATFTVAPTAAQAAGTSYVWVGKTLDTNADGHSWTDGRNWFPTGVPGNGDSVSIADVPSSCTSVQGTPAGLSLVDFSLAAGSGCSVSITGGSITVTGSFSWNGGKLDTAVTIAAGATGTISGSSGRENELARDLDVAGSLQLTGLTGAGDLQIDNLDADRAVNTLTIEPGATLNSNSDNLITYSTCCTDPARLVNNGTLQVGGGTLTVDGVAIDQDNLLAVSGGNRLVSTIAPLTMGDGAEYTGSGGWSIHDQGAQAAVAAGTQTLGAGFDIDLGGLDSTGSATLGGTATFTGAGTLNWTGGTIEGNLTFARGFTVEIAGTHDGNGARKLDGTDYSSGDVAAKVTNHGTVTVGNGAGFDTADRARFVNAANGILTLQPGTQITAGSCCTSPDRIVNQGTVRVPAGASKKPVVITNAAYSSPGGTTSIAAGRALQLVGGATGQFTGATITGGGTLGLGAPSADAGTTTIGPKTTVVLQKPYGTIDGTARFAGAGRLLWTGGSISGNVTLAPEGGVTIRGADGKTLANVGGGYTPSKLTIPARTTFSAGTAKKPNPVDLGSSTLTLAGPSTIGNHVQFYAGKLINTGRLVLNPGRRGEIDHNGSGTFLNRGSATLRSGTFSLYGNYVQAAGTTTLATGSRLARTSTSYPITVAGGTLAGTGRVAASLVDRRGTIRPGGAGVGVLRVSGAFTQGRAGTLAIDHGTTRSDALLAGGAASLNGQLVSRNVGRFHPRLGAQRLVLGAQAISGHFRCAISSGTGAAGKRAGHWAASGSGRRITVVWRKGAQTHC